MPATTTPSLSMHDRLLVGFERIHARDRLGAELARVAVDVVGPFDHDDLPPDECAWLEERVSRAVQIALEPTLAIFLDELTAGLVEAPDDLLARVTRAKLRHELGGE